VKYTIYYNSPRKQRLLKRTRSKVFLLPFLLLVPVCILTVVALKQQPEGRVPKVGASPEQATEQTAQTGQEDIAGTEADAFARTKGRTSGQEPEEPKTPEITVQEKVVQSGDTVTALLSDYMGPAEIFNLSRKCQPVYSLRRIKQGQPYRLVFQDDQLSRFEYEIDSTDKLVVEIKPDDFQACREKIEYDIREEVTQARIETSLFEAVADSGETPALAVALADIFAWDVDFIRDIRKGDSFRLIVEKRFRKGEFQGYGSILAAQFENQGRVFQAFRFEKSNGRVEYYTAKGQAVRKTFLKAPLNFTRISSGYTWSRKHPILKKIRPHLGIDYAAPRGTPIKTVADGRVLRASRDRAAGNYIKVRHTNGYVTVYNHMCRFARGIRQGTRVTQGETIGYVGSTGLSTGPHLDFRVKKNGSYINPLKIDSRPVEPVPQSEMARFEHVIQPRLAVLEGKRPLYASAGSDTGSRVF
jgi:murein DD-endopeptidase MepM/ murein hydrolase activator NlpD